MEGSGHEVAVEVNGLADEIGDRCTYLLALHGHRHRYTLSQDTWKKGVVSHDVDCHQQYTQRSSSS